MQAQFDPYRIWLGIPPEEQPANFYRLLGLAVFENDPQVISHAADRQMAHVRTFQTGRYAAYTQRLLNELSAARLCLLDKTKKQQYDTMLRGLGWGAASSAAATAAPAAAAPKAVPRAAAVPPVRQHAVPTAQPVADPYDPLGLNAVAASTPIHRTPAQRKSSSKMPLIMAGVCLVVVVVAGVLIANNLNSDAPKPVATAPAPAAAPATAAKKGADAEKDKSKESDKDKDKDKSASPAAPETEGKATDSKATDKGTDRAAKAPDASKAADGKADASKKTSDVAAKADPNAAPKKSTTKTSEKTAKVEPPVRKRPPGEVPDFGPLPPLPTNDNALELAALPMPSTNATRPVLAELAPQWKEALLKAESREEKQALVSTWLNEAGAARGNLPRQFVLLKAAYDLAVEIADAESFNKAINQLTAAFAIDPWEMKGRAFLKAGSGGWADPEDLQALLPECEKTISAAIAANRFDVAANLARAGASLAKRGKTPDDAKKFDSMIGQLDETSKGRDEFEKAQETLASRRNDPQASLVVGSYLCFVQGRWKDGLFYLKKSDDEDVKAAAELDASNPFAAEKQADVGDAWLTVAKKYKGLKRTEILKHAKSWYDRCVGSLTDKDKADVEAKLKEVAELMKG